MSILFVADRSFNDFTLLTRAFMVAIEGERRDEVGRVYVAAYDNKNLTNLLYQLADITNDYTDLYRIVVRQKHTALPEVTTVVAFNPLSYYPYKAEVKRAKANRKTTVLEY
jgi:hypothetical protein